MPQSLSNINLHLVFSTKNRAPIITEAVQPKLHAYMAGTARGLGCNCHGVGGIEDHVHLAVQFPRTMTVANLISGLKASSTRWMKSEGHSDSFSWQSGYGVFSVSQDDLPALKHYIANQRVHHNGIDFQEEHRKLLIEHGIEFDERYVWD